MGAIAAYPLSDADEAMLAKQRALLLDARSKRTAPVRDDKIMADCNGLIIAALANAGAVFRNQAWINAAVEAFDFVTTAMANGDKLFHTWRAGTRGHAGFADDYATMARAAIVLHEVTGDAALSRPCQGLDPHTKPAVSGTKKMAAIAPSPKAEMGSSSVPG